MTRRSAGFASLGLLGALALPIPASAGLGNLTYLQSELETPLASFNETTFSGPPGGSNTVLILRDYMIVMGSHDSGVADGPLHVFDVSDPRAPKLMKRFSSPETADLRELHAMPVAMLDGKDILVFPSTTGIRFFDFTDPLAPKAIGELKLDGVNAGDYDNAAWMLSWAWPYVYVGGTGNGVYVVDATDPTQPSLVTQIPLGKLGGFRVGPVYAAGNYIIASGMDAKPTEVSVLDAGDPTKPFLWVKGSAQAEMYSSVVIGDRIYGSGANGQYSLLKWSVDAVEAIGPAMKFGTDKGGYCSYQDAFIFCGQSAEGYKQLDVSDEANITLVGSADIPTAGADTDFATVLGNLVYLGNDHGSGAAFIPHSMAPDTTPPKVLKVYPSSGDLSQPLTSRITMFFSDEIDLDSVTPENILVRQVGGAAVDGVFSHSSINAISFGAKQALVKDATYEVVVVTGGLKDLAQNPIAEETVVRFSTGATIDDTPSVGGAGGMSSGGGGSSSGGLSGSTNAGQSSSVGGVGPVAGSGGVSPAAAPGSTPQEAAGCGCSLPGTSGSSRTAWSVVGLAAAWAFARGARRRRQTEGASSP